MPISRFFKRSAKKEVKQTEQDKHTVEQADIASQNVAEKSVVSVAKTAITSSDTSRKDITDGDIGTQTVNDIISGKVPEKSCLSENDNEKSNSNEMTAKATGQSEICDSSDVSEPCTSENKTYLEGHDDNDLVNSMVEEIVQKVKAELKELVPSPNDTNDINEPVTDEVQMNDHTPSTDSQKIDIVKNDISCLGNESAELEDGIDTKSETVRERTIDGKSCDDLKGPETENQDLKVMKIQEIIIEDITKSMEEDEDRIVTAGNEHHDTTNSPSSTLSMTSRESKQIDNLQSSILNELAVNEPTSNNSEDLTKLSSSDNTVELHGDNKDQIHECNNSLELEDNSSISKPVIVATVSEEIESEAMTGEQLVTDVCFIDGEQSKNKIDLLDSPKLQNKDYSPLISSDLPSIHENDSLVDDETTEVRLNCDSDKNDASLSALDATSDDNSRIQTTEDSPLDDDKKKETYSQEVIDTSNAILPEVTQVIEDILLDIENNMEAEDLFLGKQTNVDESCVGESSCSLLTDDECADDNTSSFPKKDSQNWKVGYLQVKLPSKSRKGKLKAWHKRFVVIQSDEFTSDSKTSSLMLSVYQSESGNSRRHSAMFWRSISSKAAVVYRTMSKTHPYAFTIADGNEPVLHLATDTESLTQEWMASIRNIFWPPNPVLQLEKVLNGNQFEISVIDNDLSYRAGLLGAYGFLTVASRKLILCHPQSGHVIQEWYLNTVDKFRILSQTKEEDASKVLLMQTSRDSSTGCGEIKLFCNEAVDLLKSIASTIHKVLQYHAKQNNTCYKKELTELSHWLTPQPSPMVSRIIDGEDYYKIPPRQVRSLLDIPNFIFDMPNLTVVVDKAVSNDNVSAGEQSTPKLKPSTTCVSNFSQDSGISMAPDDFLNCSITSFTIGNKNINSKDRSSGSESSDSYSPPLTPKIQKRKTLTQDNQDEV